MPDHYVKGCDRAVSYVRDNKVNVTRDRLAAALGVPIIHLRENQATFVRKCSEPQSEALANLMGLSMADCRTETGMAIAP